MAKKFEFTKEALYKLLKKDKNLNEKWKNHALGFDNEFVKKKIKFDVKSIPTGETKTLLNVALEHFTHDNYTVERYNLIVDIIESAEITDDIVNYTDPDKNGNALFTVIEKVPPFLNALKIQPKWVKDHKWMIHPIYMVEQLVGLLLHYGADSQRVDKFGNTPLSEAVDHSYVNTSKILIGYMKYKNINVSNNLNKKYGKDNLLMLNQATKNGSDAIAEFLIENGADPSLKDGSGNNAVQFAKSNKKLTALFNKKISTVTKTPKSKTVTTRPETKELSPETQTSGELSEEEEGEDVDVGKEEMHFDAPTLLGLLENNDQDPDWTKNWEQWMDAVRKALNIY